MSNSLKVKKNVKTKVSECTYIHHFLFPTSWCHLKKKKIRSPEMLNTVNTVDVQGGERRERRNGKKKFESGGGGQDGLANSTL
jgi:hypothetical protein